MGSLIKRLRDCVFYALVSMIGTIHTKQGTEQEDKPKNVKRKGELPALEMVVITNIKLFCLDICWSLKR